MQPIIPALSRQRQEDHHPQVQGRPGLHREFQVSWGYTDSKTKQLHATFAYYVKQSWGCGSVEKHLPWVCIPPQVQSSGRKNTKTKTKLYRQLGQETCLCFRIVLNANVIRVTCSGQEEGRVWKHTSHVANLALPLLDSCH